MVIEGKDVYLRFVQKNGDSMVCKEDLAKVENILGFRVLEAWVIETTMVVYRYIPPELDGLVEDTYCYNCTL